MSLSNGDVDLSNPGDEGSESNSTVIDPENYSHTRRLQAIHDARSHVVHVRNSVEDALIQRTVSEHDGRRYYRGAVEAFLLEAMPVFRADVDFADEYMEETHLGDVTLSPPEWIVSYAEDNIGRLVPGAQVPTPRQIPVYGLEDILSLPSPLSLTFSVAVDRGGGIEPQTATVQTELPRDVLDAAVQTADQALNEANIGLQIDDDAGEAELRYADLLPVKEDEEGDGE